MITYIYLDLLQPEKSNALQSVYVIKNQFRTKGTAHTENPLNSHLSHPLPDEIGLQIQSIMSDFAKFNYE